MNRGSMGLVSPLVLGFCVALVLLVVFTFGHSYQLKDFSVTDQFNKSKDIELPFLVVGSGPKNYKFTGVIETDWFAPTTYQIIPDDQVLSLKINGKSVDLSKISADRLRDVNRGFYIDLADYFEGNTQQLEVEVKDFGGEYGFTINGSFSDFKRTLLVVGWACLFFVCYLYLLRRTGLPLSAQVAYLLIVIGGIIQVWYIFEYNPVNHIFSDPQRHWEQGTDVLRADLMSLTDPIGYQLFIAALAKFTLKIPALVAYCTSLLALITPWIWYRFFRELQSSKTTALWGWALLSILPSWMAIYGYFMQETVMLPLLGASLWATWRCRRKADAASFVIMVLLWIATGLTRGIAIPLAAVCCTWLWVVQDTKLKKAVYSSIVLLLIMGPLTYRSYEMVGHFAPHGMGHLNVIYAKSGKRSIEIQASRGGSGWGAGFASPSTGAKPFYPFNDWQTQRRGTVRAKVDLQAGTRDWNKAVDSLDFDLKRYLWITKESFIFVFLAESWPDNNMARFIDQAGSVERWIWFPILLAIIVGLIVYRKKMKGSWLLPSMLLAWFIVQVLIPISVNEGRYRKPFEGLAIAQLILLASARRNQLKEGAKAQTWDEFTASVSAAIPIRITRKNDL